MKRLRKSFIEKVNNRGASRSLKTAQAVSKDRFVRLIYKDTAVYIKRYVHLSVMLSFLAFRENPYSF